MNYGYIGGGGGGAGGAAAPLNENLGGLSPPCFSPETIGNSAENWFGKIFRLVIFSQIVYNGRAWRNIIF